MTLKLLVSDMDGTLLHSDHTISQATQNAIMNLQEQGVRIVLASGRPKGRMEAYAQQLSLEKYGGFLIESNGSAIYDYASNTHEVLRNMSEEEMREVFTMVKQHYPDEEIYFMADREAYVYHPKGETKSQYFHVDYPEGSIHRDIVFIHSIEEITTPVAKICVYQKPSVIKEMKNVLSPLKNNYFVGIVMPYWIEITAIDMNKGVALHKIMDTLQIQPNEVLAFGDGENDLAMLSMVKGVAMGNAIASVKESCYHHTIDNNDDGIVEYLQKNGYINL